MKWLPFHETTRPGVRAGALGVALICLACGGGTVQFEGQMPIAIAGTPPPPPPEPPKRVEVTKEQIVIKEKVQFAYNAATILPQSFSLLDEVAATIKEHSELKKIEVGGHASTEGSDDHNLDLSKRRAAAVMEYLVNKSGVAKERLSSQGYGETKPLVTPDDTEEKREKNRRVEFVILERGEPDAKPQAASDAPAAAD
jgi:OOP family OmpA-OmpF porin